jgi:ketosteroid isomerase-like protein
MADNATLARSLYDAWNDRDFGYAGRLMGEDAQIVVVGSGTTFRGPEGIRQYNMVWTDGFPDATVAIDRIVESGDTVVVEYTGSGTHTGPLLNESGTIAPTGRSLTLQFCDVLRFAGGRLLSQRTYYDTGALMAQLGLIPASRATTTL